MLRKLRVLLAVLLCTAFALPGAAEAAPALSSTAAVAIQATDQEPAKVWAGEISSGEPEAVLQLDKTLLPPLLRNLLQTLYAPNAHTGATAGVSSFAFGSLRNHKILTKGP